MSHVPSKTGLEMLVTFAVGLALALPLAAQAAGTPEQKCEGGKNDAAGKYAACLAKAEKSFITSGDATKYGLALGKCESKLIATWDKLEAAAVAAAAVCPSTGDRSAVEDFMDACAQSVAEAVAPGGSLGPDPVTCAADLGACDSDLSTCGGSLGTCNTDLSTTNADLTTTTGSLTTCNTNLSTTNADLASCVAAGPEAKPVRTGQTLCYNTAGTVIACAGSGQDGEALKGATRSFTDNGNGTVTDNKTGLMWEKLSDNGDIHDKDTLYTWATAVTTKIVALNLASFGGHNDWRLPNVVELQTLVSFGAVSPSTYSAFNTSCAASCTVLTCSCTQSSGYWSSSTNQNFPPNAWYVIFTTGFTDGNVKTNSLRVRGVRAGS